MKVWNSCMYHRMIISPKSLIFTQCFLFPSGPIKISAVQFPALSLQQKTTKMRSVCFILNTLKVAHVSRPFNNLETMKKCYLFTLSSSKEVRVAFSVLFHCCSKEFLWLKDLFLFKSWMCFCPGPKPLSSLQNPWLTVELTLRGQSRCTLEGCNSHVIATGRAQQVWQSRGSSEEALNRWVCLEPRLIPDPSEELTQVCTSRWESKVSSHWEITQDISHGKNAVIDFCRHLAKSISDTIPPIFFLLLCKRRGKLWAGVRHAHLFSQPLQ